MTHTTLAQGRWFTLSLAEQLGNIGSEFERVLKAQEQADKIREEKALERFLELLDLTLADPRWAGRRRRELARLREQSLEELGNAQSAAVGSLSKYYLHFATAARRS